MQAIPAAGSPASITSSSLTAPRGLNVQLQEARNVLATSEAEYLLEHPFLSSDDTLYDEVQQRYMRTTDSPYGKGETVESIGRKLYGYQHGCQQSLKETILSHIPIPLRNACGKSLPWDERDDQLILTALAESGLITKEILSAFRGLVDIEELSLSQSLAPDEIDIVQVNPRRVLSVFKLPNSFVQLITLSLKNVPLKDDDVAYLNDLKELTNLDLSGTGISSEATAHLVALRHSLRCLHLGRNPKIKHQASYNLACLRNLRTLCLNGTSVKMLSLRYLVEKRVAGGDPSSSIDLTVPMACRKYLQSLPEVYHMSIPQPYFDTKDLRRLKKESYATLRRNLEFHALKQNSEVSLKGTADVLAATLKTFLRKRETDLVVRKWAKIV